LRSACVCWEDIISPPSSGKILGALYTHMCTLLLRCCRIQLRSACVCWVG
jgi:hypothetical protein